MTNGIDEILNTECMFVIGSNTTENHPIIGAKMIQAQRKGAKLIVADPRRIDLARHADIFLQIKPGSNVALLNAMANVIITEALYDKAYVDERVDGFEKLAETVKKYTPALAAEICGVAAEDIIAAARMYAGVEKAGIYYTMGITQHASGTDNVMSISNLALLCGNLGVEGAGVNPLRGQNNVQGACDVGCLPNVYPGYQKVDDPKVREKFEKAWQVEALSDKVGLTVPKIMEGAGNGAIKLLYIMGENPVVSDPDTAHVEHALKKLDFLVVQDIFLTETAALADVVLPVACFAEKDGTFTNTERRVQRVRKAVSAPGEARTDLEVFQALMAGLGYPDTGQSPQEVMAEIASVTPSYGGISYQRIEEQGLHWPCPTTAHPGTVTLHKGQFSKGKAMFLASEHQGPVELADEAYPFILTTGRVLYHYHTRTMTGRVDGLNQLSGESFIEISEAAAKDLGICDGDLVEVRSRRGVVAVKANVSKGISGNTVFMPFHFAQGSANRLTNSALDPVSNVSELKVCAVRIEKIR